MRSTPVVHLGVPGLCYGCDGSGQQVWVEKIARIAEVAKAVARHRAEIEKKAEHEMAYAAHVRSERRTREELDAHRATKEADPVTDFGWAKVTARWERQDRGAAGPGSGPENGEASRRMETGRGSIPSRKSPKTRGMGRPTTRPEARLKGPTTMITLDTIQVKKFARLTIRIHEQRRWIKDHGGTPEGYIKRYGKPGEPGCHGQGGDAIHRSDINELVRLEMKFEALYGTGCPSPVL